jgi:hypothetical protein
MSSTRAQLSESRLPIYYNPLWLAVLALLVFVDPAQWASEAAGGEYPIGRKCCYSCQ